jgi:hypothetical protein
MTPYRKRNCPITRRLAEDLMIRNMAETTIDAYTYHVRRFYDFIGKPLDTVTPADVRTFRRAFAPNRARLLVGRTVGTAYLEPTTRKRLARAFADARSWSESYRELLGRSAAAA